MARVFDASERRKMERARDKDARVSISRRFIDTIIRYFQPRARAPLRRHVKDGAAIYAGALSGLCYYFHIFTRIC